MAVWLAPADGEERTYLRQEVWPLDIHGYRAVEGLLVRRGQVHHRQHARVEHQDVDLPPPLHDLLHHLLESRDVAGVRLDGERPVGADLRNKLVRGGGGGGVVDDHFGAQGGEVPRGGEADAAGGAGDEGDFVGEGEGTWVRHGERGGL